MKPSLALCCIATLASSTARGEHFDLSEPAFRRLSLALEAPCPDCLKAGFSVCSEGGGAYGKNFARHFWNNSLKKGFLISPPVRKEDFELIISRSATPALAEKALEEWHQGLVLVVAGRDFEKVELIRTPARVKATFPPPFFACLKSPGGKWEESTCDQKRLGSPEVEVAWGTAAGERVVFRNFGRHPENRLEYGTRKKDFLYCHRERAYARALVP